MDVGTYAVIGALVGLAWAVLNAEDIILGEGDESTTWGGVLLIGSIWPLAIMFGVCIIVGSVIADLFGRHRRP